MENLSSRIKKFGFILRSNINLDKLILTKEEPSRDNGYNPTFIITKNI